MRISFPRFRLRLLAFCLATFASGWILLAALHRSPAHINPARQSPEIHAVWMTHLAVALMDLGTWQDEALHRLARLRFDRVYPCVWNGGYTLHRSAVTERYAGSPAHPLWSWTGRDPLLGFAREAHRQGLKVMPWFEYGLAVPANSDLARRHPEWLSRDVQGRVVAEADLLGAAWLNPFHPEVERFLVELAVEVVGRYPVDGIQFDDHFAMPVQTGYDSYTVRQYRKEHRGRIPPANHRDTGWMRWRSARLTKVMASISAAVKKRKPLAVVSISPNPAGSAYSRSLQDWPDWVRRGLVDEVVVQVYRPDVPRMLAVLKERELIEARRRVPVVIGVYTGSILKPKPLTEIAQQVQLVRKLGYSGVSLFCWETALWLFGPGSEAQLDRFYEKLLRPPAS